MKTREKSPAGHGIAVAASVTARARAPVSAYWRYFSHGDRGELRHAASVRLSVRPSVRTYVRMYAHAKRLKF
jgi:hypothetical protein